MAECSSNIMLCGAVPNICQKHVQGLPDLPSSDYSFKMFDNFHCKITPLILKIPIQWFVTFLEMFDQIWETFGMCIMD